MIERIFWLGVALACAGLAVVSLFLMFYAATSSEVFVNVFALVFAGTTVMSLSGAIKSILRVLFGDFVRLL